MASILIALELVIAGGGFHVGNATRVDVDEQASFIEYLHCDKHRMVAVRPRCRLGPYDVDDVGQAEHLERTAASDLG